MRSTLLYQPLRQRAAYPNFRHRQGSDARVCLYTYLRTFSELYLVKGVH
jgi:hypothetical protein